MSIQAKHIRLLVSFTVIPILIFSVILFSKARQSLMDVRIAQLNNIADLKKDKIETFFHERESDLRAAQNFYIIKRNLPEISKFINNKEALHKNKYFIQLNNQISNFEKSYAYLNVMLVNPQGVVVYCSNNNYENNFWGKTYQEGSVFEESKNKIYFSDVSKTLGPHFKMTLAGPLTDFNGKFIGEIVIDMNMEPVYKFIANTTGLGNTGESVLVRKDGEEILFLNQLRLDPEAPLKRRATFKGRIAYPAQMALRGENGSGVAYDYNDDEVLATWRYLPKLRWGLVNKIKASEAFAPITKLRNVVLCTTLIILIIGIILARKAARNITEPILALQKGAEVIGSGNLNYKVATQSKDEVGKLSQLFDAMSDNLKASQEKFLQLNRTLKASANIMQAVMSMKEEAAFLKETCRIIVEDCGYTMVWIGFAENDEKKSIRAAAYAGFEEGYLETLKLTWEDNDRGRGPTGTAIRSGKMTMCKNMQTDPTFLPWRNEAIKRGYTSSVVFPLKKDDKPFGSLTLYLSTPDHFSTDELQLLEELADRLAYGITVIRLHVEKEKLDVEMLKDKLSITNLNQNLKSQMKKLEETNQELDAYSYSVSHDLRSPLNAIGGFSKILLEDNADKMDENGKANLTRIISATGTMNKLIDDLLSMSRVSNAEMKFETVNLSQITAKIAQKLKETEPQRSVNFIIADGLSTYGAGSLLEILLDNIIRNSWKFSSKKPQAIIEFGTTERDGKSVYFVKDNGAGFDMKYIDKLFTPFQRLHSMSEFQGTGLGLTIVRRIIARHGGNVWIEGELDKGTTVYFYI